MQHFKTYFNYGYGDVATDYPHSPEDVEQSFNDWLEEELSEGWELVSHGSSASSSAIPVWVFKAVGRLT
jgi:hypothetical protein